MRRLIPLLSIVMLAALMYAAHAQQEDRVARFVVRTPNGNDYGKDLLRLHYLQYPHSTNN